ncbi:hypothetical protein PR202_ga01517 [Eleusine coracana subsp. coracana]|uniref:Uncharacterized protein n=1 Tax=Eleusine coracana subsp. coracana TaxID=191504 RepID=A0AAV5BH21_ELECO|nr:hypothetical protein PR202_ga00830 [Eleusine coracana subsp. coracana]GJM85724.1 hypothetical protein PR202_ga01517 [Eleusine coracana subsp. coracana]
MKTGSSGHKSPGKEREDSPRGLPGILNKDLERDGGGGKSAWWLRRKKMWGDRERMVAEAKMWGDRERMGAEAKMWGENWRDKRRAVENGQGSLDSPTETG